ncbi:probable alpha,alpha-trehalose-phosphate synthase [UDP-forming] 7 [Tanacetum coccineum]
MAENRKQADFVLCIGDDRFDEDMFEVISNAISGNMLSVNTNVFACTSGQKPRKAKYYLDDTSECVAVDAVVECDLVSTLVVSIFPELIFTETRKILQREKEIRITDELSKIMAYFYYGGAKPPCLDTSVIINDAIPSFTSKK